MKGRQANTKSVLESDHVTETDDAFELSVPVDSLAVPATLQDSLMARLDRQPSAKEVAQVAACMGREFDTESLWAITGFGDATLTGALDQLCEVEVVSHRGIAPNMSYRFRHALLCDAAYQSLLKARRRAIHGRSLSPWGPL
jgi:predicted ATPase